MAMPINPDLAELLATNRRGRLASFMAPVDRFESLYDRIVREVADLHGMTAERLRSRNRCGPISNAKREACVRLRTLGLSMPAIAKLVGLTNHTTVLHHLRKAREAA